jgi:hypothetical protein
MSGFVEECQKEWKRLGVSQATANEMAADLEADLAEAEPTEFRPRRFWGTATSTPGPLLPNGRGLAVLSTRTPTRGCR